MKMNLEQDQTSHRQLKRFARVTLLKVYSAFRPEESLSKERLNQSQLVSLNRHQLTISLTYTQRGQDVFEQSPHEGKKYVDYYTSRQRESLPQSLLALSQCCQGLTPNTP